MNMDNKSLSAVNQKFNARKKERDVLIRERKNEIYAAIPRVRELENAISGGGFKMLSAVWEGKATPEAIAGEFADKAEKAAAEIRKLLREAGYPADYLNPPYQCPHCSDTGMHDGKLCSCYLSLMTEELYNASQMGSLLKKQTFDRFDITLYPDKPEEGKTLSARENMRVILRECRAFVEKFGERTESLIFYGNPGLGKTFLSSAIANALLKRGISVLYQSAGQIFDTLADVRFGRNENTAANYLREQLLRVELLIIDDLGTEFINTMTEADLFYVINSRILAEKSTIISTNMKLGEIRSQYSDRILSRILGHYKTMDFFGKDIRSMNI